MTPEIGSLLRQYRLVEMLGEGGMGVVFRATDTRLDRDVAVKILPDVFARDAERLARFDREAKLLAALNHPNIATLHGLEQDGEVRFLVMELVPGEDLARRLARGPLPVEEALAVARQLAEALESAHEHGVIHRDLKPANVQLTPEGRVKVLDFGLAKALDPVDARTDASHSPTVTSAGTVAGVILGTAAYMSPEQAKGKPVDRRADIWAFGVLLAEMLGGRRLFAGESISETLAAVLMAEIDLAALPPNTPPRVRRLIERCLRRDPASRLRDAGDVRIVLDEALAAREWTLPAANAAGTTAASRSGRAWAVGLVALGLVAGAGLATLFGSGVGGSGRGSKRSVSRVALPLPPALRVSGRVRLTPDGRAAVFFGYDTTPGVVGPRGRLYVRWLDRDEPVVVEGSESPVAALSPDGSWLAFAARPSEHATRWQLMKVPLDQSDPPVKLADLPDDAAAIAWTTAETIVVFLEDRSMVPVSAESGTAGTPVKLSDELRSPAVSTASVLPDGRHVLLHYASFDSGAFRQDLGTLDTETGEFEKLLDDGSHPTYAPSGHLIFGRRDTLLVAPFDATTRRVTGAVRPAVSGVWAEGLYTGGTSAVSQAGDLLHSRGGVQGSARWLATSTLDGDTVDWSADRLAINWTSVSPDGRWVLAGVDNIGEGDALLQIRASEIGRPRLVTVGTRPGKDCRGGNWSPRSDRFAYSCWDQRVVDLHLGRPDSAASEPPLFRVEAPDAFHVVGISADAGHVYVHVHGADGSQRMLAVPAIAAVESATDGVEVKVEEREWDEPVISADGRLMAYVSSDTGRREIYVRELREATEVGPRTLVTTDVADLMWGKRSADGRYELFFQQRDRLLSVEFTPGPVPRISEPRLHAIDLLGLGVVDVEPMPDGRLMLVRSPDSERGAAELRLIQNWALELK